MRQAGPSVAPGSGSVPRIVGVVGLVVELPLIQDPPAQLHGALEMLEEPGAQPAREEVVVPEDGRQADELQRQLRQAQARQEDLQVRPAFPVGEHLNFVGDHQPDALEGARLAVENLLHLLVDHHRDLELLFLDGLVVLAVVARRDHHPRPAGPIAVAEGLELLRGQGLEGHEIHGLPFLADDVGRGHLADEGLPGRGGRAHQEAVPAEEVVPLNGDLLDGQERIMAGRAPEIDQGWRDAIPAEFADVA